MSQIGYFISSLGVVVILRASQLAALNIEDLPTSHGKNSVWVFT
jgi:hypothetical protein